MTPNAGYVERGFRITARNQAFIVRSAESEGCSRSEMMRRIIDRAEHTMSIDDLGFRVADLARSVQKLGDTISALEARVKALEGPGGG